MEEVGRFVQTHHANFDQLIPSNIPSVQQVFLDRVGCYYVKSKWILKHQDPPLGIVNACSFLAWSHGLKVFGVRNGSECLGDKHLPSILPGLNGSKGCLGGRGGQNMSDVYRLTSRRIYLIICHSTFQLFIIFSLDRSFIHLTIYYYLVRTFISATYSLFNSSIC